MNYQWYPGHMTKAKRQMQEDLKLIDLIIELVDARVPVSSRNPDIDAMGRNKARLILLNKADLADERCNQKWMDYFKEKGFYAVKVNSRSGAGLKGIQAVVQEACREKIERDRKRGIMNRPVRAMVVMVPVEHCEEIGVRPIVDRAMADRVLDEMASLQVEMTSNWNRRYRENMERLKSGDLFQVAQVVKVIRFLVREYPGVLAERYQIEEQEEPLRILEQIAENRKCMQKGGALDYAKASGILMDEFRNGKLGRITLESAAGSEVTE